MLLDAGKIGFVVGLAAEARLLRGTAFMVGVGGGMPAGAAEAAEALVAQGARALISFGLAGGLNPRLISGAILIPTTVINGVETFVCDADLAKWLGGATIDTMVAGEKIAVTRAEKAALFADYRADSIDLESGAVARVASDAKVPFAVLRAVADPAWRELPPAAMIALDTVGKINLFPVLASVFRKPSQIPALIALAQDAGKARAALVGRLKELSRA